MAKFTGNWYYGRSRDGYEWSGHYSTKKAAERRGKELKKLGFIPKYAGYRVMRGEDRTGGWDLYVRKKCSCCGLFHCRNFGTKKMKVPRLARIYK